MSEPPTTASVIRNRMFELNLTQQKACKEARVSRPTLRKILQGKYVRQSTVELVCTALGLEFKPASVTPPTP